MYIKVEVIDELDRLAIDRCLGFRDVLLHIILCCRAVSLYRCLSIIDFFCKPCRKVEVSRIDLRLLDCPRAIAVVGELIVLRRISECRAHRRARVLVPDRLRPRIGVSLERRIRRARTVFTRSPCDVLECRAAYNRILVTSEHRRIVRRDRCRFLGILFRTIVVLGHGRKGQVHLTLRNRIIVPCNGRHGIVRRINNLIVPRMGGINPNGVLHRTIALACIFRSKDCRRRVRRTRDQPIDRDDMVALRHDAPLCIGSNPHRCGRAIVDLFQRAFHCCCDGLWRDDTETVSLKDRPRGDRDVIIDVTARIGERIGNSLPRTSIDICRRVIRSACSGKAVPDLHRPAAVQMQRRRIDIVPYLRGCIRLIVFDRLRPVVDLRRVLHGKGHFIGIGVVDRKTLDRPLAVGDPLDLIIFFMRSKGILKCLVQIRILHIVRRAVACVRIWGKGRVPAAPVSARRCRGRRREHIVVRRLQRTRADTVP